MRFRDLPIRRKLMLAILLTSITALLWGGGAMVFFEQIRFRHSLADELSTETEIIAANSAAAVAFQDHESAREILAALRNHPAVVHACLFTADGKLFVQYISGDTDQNFPALVPEPSGNRFEKNYALVFRPVKLGADVVGSIALRSDLREESARLKVSLSIAMVALLAALFVSLLLSVRFQKLISRPVLELANVAHAVMEQKDYSLRAVQRGNDEIGQLIGAFNQMLTKIEKRDVALGASEERFRQLAENISEVFWITDPAKQKIIYLSPAYETVWGQTCASVYDSPQNWMEAIHLDDRERVLGAMTKQEKGEYDEIYRIARPDGSLRWIHDRAFPVRDKSGKVYRIAGIAEDITERKRAEDTLRRTEQLYRQAIVRAGAIPYALDYRTRKYLFMGEGIERMIGYSQHEINGGVWKSIAQEAIMLGEANGLTLEEAGKRTSAGQIKTWRCDMRVLSRDGQVRWISDTSVQNLDESGQLVGSMGILQDITDRKQAEKQNEAFSSLATRLSAATTPKEAAANILDTANALIGWDCAYINLYDRETDSILPILTFDLVDGGLSIIPEKTPREPGLMTRVIMEKGALLVDEQSRATLPFAFTPFGNENLASTSMIFVPIRQSANAIGVLSIQRYTAKSYTQENLNLLQALADHCSGALERIRATEELLKAEAKYRGIFEDATEGIFQSVPAGRYLSANPALARMFGYETPEEMIAGITDIEKQTYVIPEKRMEWMRLLESQKSVHGFEAELIRKDGSKFWISVNVRAVRDDNNAVLRYEGIIRDITARKHLEKQLTEISDREQSRMGQDLHDGLCQHLVRTAFAANLLEKDMVNQTSTLDQARKVSQLMDDAITQARNLARGLYPVKLEAEGFYSAMQELAANIRSTYYLDCEFESCDSLCITDHALATHLYRIAQEGAVNAAKHAKPTKIRIRLNHVANKIFLTVSDNGTGISANTTRPDSMGLHIMNYRASMIGAALKVEPQPNGGTIVSCVFEHKNSIGQEPKSTNP